MNPNQDETLRALGEYLQTRLNALSQAALGTDAIDRYLPVDPWYAGRDADDSFLLLFRLESENLGIDCRIRVVLFIRHSDDRQNVEGYPRWLEANILKLLMEYRDYQDCVKVMGSPKCMWGLSSPMLSFDLDIEDRHIV